MNILNKYEAIGIGLSVFLMVFALGYIRFQTGALTFNKGSAEDNTASVVSVTKEQALHDKLKDSMSQKGEVTKLVIDDVVIGTGETTEDGDTIVVHYAGALQGGEKFDSSYDRGEPFEFTIGEGRVIAGWEKGFLGMKVGGKRVLVIPSDMAYGNRQVGPIPPNSTLVFTVELLEIKK